MRRQGEQEAKGRMLQVATKLVPQPEALEQAYRAGFRHVEFWLDVELLERWQELARWGRYYPLSYVLHFPNRRPVSDGALEGFVALYRELSCRAMVIHQGMYEAYGRQLESLAPELRIGIENHKLSGDGLIDWAERSPGLTLDVEHLWKFTLADAPLERLASALEDLLARYGSKLRHVHLPGYLPGGEEHRPMYCSRELVFTTFSLLARAGYEGLIVSEVAPEFQNEHELRMDVLLFDRWRQLHEAWPASRPQSSA